MTTKNTPAQGSYTWKQYFGALFGLLRPQFSRLGLLAGMLLLQLTYALLFPLGLQQLFDSAIPSKNFQLLALLLAGLTVGFFVSAVATWQMEKLASRIGSLSMGELRQKMFEHLQHLPSGYYHTASKGALLSRFSNDLQTLEQVTTRGLSYGMFNVFLLISSVVLLFVVEWRLALLTLLVSPLLLSGPSFLGARTHALSSERKESDAELSDLLQEQVGGFQTIRTFGLEKYIRDRYLQQVDQWTRVTSRMNYFSGLSGLISYSSVMFLILSIVALGSYFAASGTFSVGGLVAFVGLLLNVDEASRGLNQILPPLQQSQSGMERIQEFLAEPTLSEEDNDREVVLSDKAPLRFKDVGFGYTSEHRVLKELNFAIERGLSVAFVGRSGSGKSTVLQLLMRSYKPQEGQIFLGDVALQEMGWTQFRQQMGVVFQHTFLFNTTLRENIRLGRLDATDREVEEVARVVELHDFIETLPQGYDTLVGDVGISLSGGQSQRVAIARALLRDPSILLLDEATSALDPATEVSINEALETLAEGRTVIQVTHRLAAATRLDRIFVMEQGELVEQGTHSELLEKGGFYARLWQKQSGFQLDQDGRHARVEAKRLKEIPLLTELAEEHLETIAHRFETEQFEEGQTIIEQNTIGKKFFILIRGKADVLLLHRVEEEGETKVEETLLNRFEIGDYFGEIALLSNVLTTATVRARTNCTCLSLARAQFHNLLEEYPILDETIRPLMERRFQETSQSLEKQKEKNS